MSQEDGEKIRRRADPRRPIMAVIHLATVTDKEDAEKKRAGLGASIALDAVLGIAAAVMAFKAHACESRPKQIGIACLALVLPHLWLASFFFTNLF